MSEPTTPSTPPPPPAELSDLREVMRRTRLSRSTIYALKAAGLFPPSPSTSAPTPGAGSPPRSTSGSQHAPVPERGGPSGDGS